MEMASLLEKAQELFLTDGCVVPVAFTEFSDHVLVITALKHFGYPDGSVGTQRRHLYTLGLSLGKQYPHHEVRSVALVGEIWFVPEDEKVPGMRVHSHWQKKEGVFCLLLDPSVGQEQAELREIIRVGETVDLVAVPKQQSKGQETQLLDALVDGIRHGRYTPAQKGKKR